MNTTFNSTGFLSSFRRNFSLKYPVVVSLVKQFVCQFWVYIDFFVKNIIGTLFKYFFVVLPGSWTGDIFNFPVRLDPEASQQPASENIGLQIIILSIENVHVV